MSAETTSLPAGMSGHQVVDQLRMSRSQSPSATESAQRAWLMSALLLARGSPVDQEEALSVDH
eukprot:26651-Eustigmatos_ZCMA.PRE.1